MFLSDAHIMSVSKRKFFFCVFVSVLVNWILLIFIKFLSFSPMQAFVRFCALVMATTVEVCAIVKKVTKVLNVKSQQENVKCLGALGMDVVLKANAIVSAVSKDTTAPNVSFSHPLVVHRHPNYTYIFQSHWVAIYIFATLYYLQLTVWIQLALHTEHASMVNATVSFQTSLKYDVWTEEILANYNMCARHYFSRRQSWMAGRRLQHCWSTSLSMLARLFGAWHLWFGNGHLYLWSPLDWTRLLSRLVFIHSFFLSFFSRSVSCAHFNWIFVDFHANKMRVSVA